MSEKNEGMRKIVRSQSPLNSQLVLGAITITTLHTLRNKFLDSVGHYPVTSVVSPGLPADALITSIERILNIKRPLYFKYMAQQLGSESLCLVQFFHLVFFSINNELGKKTPYVFLLPSYFELLNPYTITALACSVYCAAM